MWGLRVFVSRGRKRLRSALWRAPDPREMLPILPGGNDTCAPTQASPAAPRLGRGDSVGRYVVLDLLGEGSMGVVYAAYDPQLDRRVALKMVRPEASGDGGQGSEGSDASQQRERLLREAQAMAKLSHANVLPVYDAGMAGDEVFVAMEYVAGETLRSWLERHRAPGRSCSSPSRRQAAVCSRRMRRASCTATSSPTMSSSVAMARSESPTSGWRARLPQPASAARGQR